MKIQYGNQHRPVSYPCYFFFAIVSFACFFIVLLLLLLHGIAVRLDFNLSVHLALFFISFNTFPQRAHFYMLFIFIIWGYFLFVYIFFACNWRQLVYPAAQHSPNHASRRHQQHSHSIIKATTTITK